MSLIDFINDMTPMQRYQYILSLNEETQTKVKKKERKKIVRFLNLLKVLF